MEEATKLLLQEILDSVKSLEVLIREQNSRIRKLEVWRGGVVAIMLAALTIFGVWIKW